MVMMLPTRNEDRLAVEVFTRCQAAGRPVDLPAVEALLGELLAHQPGCRCGLCDAAARVRPARVLAVARSWAGGIAASRRRATR